VDRGWAGVVKLLLQDGLDPNVSNALRQAILAGRFDIATTMLDYHADPSEGEAPDKPTLVAEVFLNNHPGMDRARMIEALVSHGAKVNYGGDYRLQPLYLALIDKRDFKADEVLIAHGGNVNLDIGGGFPGSRSGGTITRGNRSASESQGHH
jgi:hypothetical protein